MMSPSGQFYKVPDDKLEEILKPFEMSAEDVKALIEKVREAKAAAEASGDTAAKSAAEEVAGYLYYVEDLVPEPHPSLPRKKIFPGPMPLPGDTPWRFLAM